MPRRKKRTPVFGDYYMIVYLMIPIIALAIVAYPDAMGLDPDVGRVLINIFPSLFLASIAIYTLRHSDKTGRMGSFLIIGVALCLFLAEADAEGLISVELLSGLTVVETQIWVMAISAIFGAVAFAR